MESSGKLVIDGIANDDVAQKVIAFLCANTKNMTAEIASARLKNLPLLLASRITAVHGTRIASLLCEMGAEAVFIPNGSDSSIEGLQQPEVEPVTIQTEQIKSEIPAPPSPDLGPSPQTQSAKPPANPGRELPKPRNTDFDSHEIAIAQKHLVWGVMAGVLSLPSPVVVLLAIPLQLYIAHRITKALKASIALRVISLLLVMVPLINIILLLVLRACTSKTLRDSRFNALGGNSTPSLLAPAYVAFLALYTVVGYSTNWVPWAMYNVQLSSTGEKQLGQSSQKNLSKEENIKYVLEAAAQDYNKELPKEIDIHMRLETITIEPDNIMTFHITETSRPSSAINKDTFRTSMTPRIRKDVCEKIDGKPFPYMKDGVSVAYAYSGNDGNEITTIVITPADCGIRSE